MPIHITAFALDELSKLSPPVVSDKPNEAIRIGVKGGGCSGLSYIMGYDAVTENDNVYELDNIKIIINKAQELYLMGTELTFENGLNNRGFTFSNPNATQTCGCGSSFAV